MDLTDLPAVSNISAFAPDMAGDWNVMLTDVEKGLGETEHTAGSGENPSSSPTEVRSHLVPALNSPPASIAVNRLLGEGTSHCPYPL